MSQIRGMDCKMFYNSGSYGTPSWDEVTSVESVEWTLELDQIEANRRGNNGFKTYVAGLKDLTLTFNVIKDKDDTAGRAIQTEFLAGTDIELAIYDGPNASGSEGWDAIWEITNWGEAQDLGDIVKIPVTAKASGNSDIPSPLFVTGALPTSRP